MIINGNVNVERISLSVFMLVFCQSNVVYGGFECLLSLEVVYCFVRALEDPFLCEKIE